MKNIINILDIMRSSLDIQETLSNICFETGKLFKVQRAAITQIDMTGDKPAFSIKEEIFFKKKIKGLENLKEERPEYFDAIVNYLPKFLKKNKLTVVIPDISKTEFPQIVKDAYNYIGIKSILSAPIIKSNNKWGWIVLAEYNYCRDWTKAEIDLLEMIAHQAHLTINKAELYEKEKKALEKERLIRHIIELTRNSLDINKTKQTIIDVIAKALNADRCFIMEYDKHNDRFMEATEEYLSSGDLKSYIGVDLNKHIPGFINDFKSGKSLIFNESIFKLDNKAININDGSYEAEKQAIEDYKVFSAVVVPMFYVNEFLGELVIHNVDKNHNASEEEMDFLKMVSGQLAIAIHQAKLYEITKKQLVKEIHLNNIINKIRSSLDINETLNYICLELYKIFNSEMAVIIQFVDVEGKPKVKYIKEYTEHENLFGFSSSELNPLFDDFVVSYFSKNPASIIPDIQESDLPDFLKEDYKKIGAKSLLTAAIKKDNHLWGAIALTNFTHYKNWSVEERNLFETLAAQVYIAINQSELYEKERATAERESLINKIMDKIRQSLDIKEIKTAISSEIGNYLGAERVVIHQFDRETNKYLIIDENSEYRSSDEIVSFVGVDLEMPELSFFKNLYTKKQELVEPCFLSYIKNLSEVEPEIREWLLSLNVKSNYVFPILYKDELIASLYITYDTKSVAHTVEELDNIRSLIPHIAIALNQAELYEKEKQELHKEQFLRKISEITKNNTNMDDALHAICKDLTEFLSVSGVRINLIDLVNNCIYGLNGYFTNIDIMSINFNSDIQNYIVNKVKKESIRMIVSHSDDFKENEEINEIIKKIKVGAFVWFANRDSGDVTYGLTVIDDKIRNWSDYEINIIEKVFEYIGKIIVGATLYSRNLFISNVMHELKNPLTAINTFSEAIINRDKDKSEITSKFIVKIKNNTDRLNSIIDNMLFVSSIAKLPNKNEDISLNDAINDSIDSVKEQASSKESKILFDLKKDYIVSADKELLTQAFVNILNNAIKYSPNNSTIKIQMESENQNICIKITDNGCGIPKEHLDNIFEPFYRVDKTRNKETGGIGLGLYITKNIINKLGGNINCESEANVGTAFNICMPLKNNI